MNQQQIFEQMLKQRSFGFQGPFQQDPRRLEAKPIKCPGCEGIIYVCNVTELTCTCGKLLRKKQEVTV